MGARGSVVGWGAMLQAGRSRVQVPDSDSNRNEYQELMKKEFLGSKARPASKADKFTAIFETIV
jgi:hypothetical protein